MTAPIKSRLPWIVALMAAWSLIDPPLNLLLWAAVILLQARRVGRGRWRAAAARRCHWRSILRQMSTG
jgi:hypothetical protein